MDDEILLRRFNSREYREAAHYASELDGILLQGRYANIHLQYADGNFSGFRVVYAHEKTQEDLLALLRKMRDEGIKFMVVDVDRSCELNHKTNPSVYHFDIDGLSPYEASKRWVRKKQKPETTPQVREVLEMEPDE